MYSGLVFTSQSCVVNPLFDLGPVHQHSEGVSEEQLARARLESPPVILYDRNAVLRSTKRHVTVRRLRGYVALLWSSSHRQKRSIVPALCHCRASGPLWDWFAHALHNAMENLCKCHVFFVHLLYCVKGIVWIIWSWVLSFTYPKSVYWVRKSNILSVCYI